MAAKTKKARKAAAAKAHARRQAREAGARAKGQGLTSGQKAAMTRRAKAHGDVRSYQQRRVGTKPSGMGAPKTTKKSALKTPSKARTKPKAVPKKPVNTGGSGRNTGHRGGNVKTSSTPTGAHKAHETRALQKVVAAAKSGGGGKVGGGGRDRSAAARKAWATRRRMNPGKWGKG